MKIQGTKLNQVNIEFEQDWNAFLYDCNQLNQYIGKNKLDELDQFNQTFYNNYTSVVNQLSSLTLEFRRGQKNESALDQYYEDVEYLEDQRLENLPFYKRLSNYLDNLDRFKKDIPNMIVLNKSNDYDNYLMANSDEDIVVYSFNYENCKEGDYYPNYYLYEEISDNRHMFGNNLTLVSFNYEIYDRLAKHLVNKQEKCVICLFSKSALIAFDLKQFRDNNNLTIEKVDQIRNKLGKFNLSCYYILTI